MRKNRLLRIALSCFAAIGLLLVLAATTAMGQQAPAPAATMASSGLPAELPRLTAIPRPLSLKNQGEVHVSDGTVLRIVSKGGTNLFVSPSGTNKVVNAPMVLFAPDRDFILRAKVSAAFRNVYDVGALVVFDGESHWAKLCFENSVRKEATVVSVVTREYSDDSNSTAVNTPDVYLAVARKGDEWSFHFSRDGREWQLVRHFRMSFSENAQLGFAVHNSRGDGFSATFSEIGYVNRSPKSMRQLASADLLP